MNRRRRLGAGPDDSIEAGSFEDTALEDTVTGASEHDFLSQDDWLIETDGPEIPRRPGEKIPRGRPKTGAEQPWAEVALLARLLAMDKPGKRLLGEQLALDVVINRGELAKQAGIPRPNLYRWARKVRQNDPKGGGAMSNTTEVPTIVERISALEVEFEQKKVEIAELARQVGLRFDDDDVQDAVQRLLDDVSNS